MQFTALGQTLLDQTELPNQGTEVLTPGATVAATLGGIKVLTLTPAQSCTINATGGANNQSAIFEITTSGTSSFTITFGTNFKAQGTLATGTVSGKVFVVQFTNIAGTWTELARTTAM